MQPLGRVVFDRLLEGRVALVAVLRREGCRVGRGHAGLNHFLDLPLELRPLAVDLKAEQPVVVVAAIGGPRVRSLGWTKRDVPLAISQ